jgi:17beta-estradiol 17-dehydrogenase / very-long-chain 3-oxoacyl-CoA reductase
MSTQTLSLFLSVIGALTLTRLIFTAARRTKQLIFHQSTFSRYVSQEPGQASWALVTGASDGIGLGFAKELCSRGVNIILHGRNEAKLEGVKAELIATNPERQVQIVVVDAARFDSKKEVDAIIGSIQSLPNGGILKILVNNVGGANALIGKGIFFRLEDTTVDEVDTLLNVNVRFPTRLTAALMHILEKNAPTLIINVGSVAGVFDLPYQVIYNGAKAFNHAFSTALAAEMRTEGQDVEVLGLITGSVDTPGAPKEDQGGPFCIEPWEMAKSTLDQVGCGEPLIYTNWKHWLTGVMLDLTPQSIIFSKMKENWRKSKKAK